MSTPLTDENRVADYTVFARPRGGSDAAGRMRLIRLIETTHAQCRTGDFLRKYRSHLDSSSIGLLDFLENWLLDITDFDSVWATPFAALHNTEEQKSRAVGLAVGVGLHLASLGRTGTWNAKLPEPAVLRWGRFVLPAAVEVSVNSTSDSEDISLVALDGRTLNVGFTQSGDAEVHPPSLKELVSVRGQRAPWLLSSSTVPPNSPIPSDVSGSVAPVLLPNDVTAFGDALDLLQRVPVYSEWVERVVREIAVLNVPTGHMRSGSASGWPGLVYMSVSEPVVLAENLVHEASHQYFHLLERVGPVDDGSDMTMYYSPVVGRTRPLSAILVAFHAFANVMIFFRQCKSGDMRTRGYIAARQAELVPKLRALREPLRENAALSATGRALAEPLFEELEDLW